MQEQTAANTNQKTLFGQKPKLFLSHKAVGGIDLPFLIITLMLLCFGMVMLYSVSYPVSYYTGTGGSHYVKRQLLFSALGLLGMFAFSQINYNWLKNVISIGYLVVLVLLVLVFFMPEKNYAHRWISIPANADALITFQPSEIAKLELIIAFARIGTVNRFKMNKFRYGVLSYLTVLLPVGVLVFAEPHLSGTIILIAITGIMMFAAGTDWRYFLVVIALVGLLAVAVVAFPNLIPVSSDRIAMWRDPSADPTGKGMQTLQGLMAIGSGGWTGLGLGNSRQKYMYVPEPYNDSIFAIICEELGFIGALVIIALFTLFLLRGVYIAVHAKDRFGALLVIGIVAQVIIQVVLNILVVTNTVPYTGITLPFFSYGGTALSLLLAEMGIVLSVSRQATLT